RDPSPTFDTARYLAAVPHAAESPLTPLAHAVVHRSLELGLRPSDDEAPEGLLEEAVPAAVPRSGAERATALRAAIEGVVRPGSRVGIVSDGDAALLRLPGYQAQHVPAWMGRRY